MKKSKRSKNRKKLKSNKHKKMVKRMPITSTTGVNSEPKITVPIFSGETITYQEKPITEALIYGMGIHQAGRLQAAESIYNQVLSIHPDNPDALQLMGLLADNVGKYNIAADLMSRSLQIEPNQPDVWSNLGFVLWKLGQFEESEKCCRESLRIRPDNVLAQVNLGNALKDQGRIDTAAAVYQKAAAQNSEMALNNLGNLYKEQGKLTKALGFYKRAIKLQAQNVTTLSNLGVANFELGELDEARNYYEQALKIRPEYVTAHYNLAFLKKYTCHDEQLRSMRDLFNNQVVSGEDRISLGFALGKAYEDLGDYKLSFRYMNEGNRLKRSTYNYNIQQTRELFEGIKRTFKRHLFDSLPSCGVNDPSPIFVLGMPRSGTTLVEQILASHPEVCGAGELNDLHQVISEFQHPGTSVPYPGSIHGLSADQISRLGDEYLQRLRHHDLSARYITDKMPRNFEYIGMIQLMLPEARIIHCMRSPMDNCYSIFKKYFAHMQPFSYDQKEIGQYYIMYRDLMDHWREVLPGRIFNIQYENLIADQEQQTRCLLDFCGLEWHDDCLKFYKTRRQVQTASAAQVRQPIYKSSVQAWKHYESYLQPMLDVLKEYGLAGHSRPEIEPAENDAGSSKRYQPVG